MNTPTQSPTQPLTQSMTICGHSFTIPAPYSPGPHNLTPGEAEALNTTLADRINKNLSYSIKTMLAKGASFESIAERVATYAAVYRFRARSEASLELEARRIAIKALGIDASRNVNELEIARKLHDDPAIWAEARARLEARGELVRELGFKL